MRRVGGIGRRYDALPEAKCVFDCIPRFVSLLLLEGKDIHSSFSVVGLLKCRIMPESLVVIGSVERISYQQFSLDKVVQLVTSGCSVVLIEGYGVLVTGSSPMQVGCWRQVNSRLTIDWRCWRRQVKRSSGVINVAILFVGYRRKRQMKYMLFLVVLWFHVLYLFV